MEVGDWITLGAVIVALGIGVASILHTQSIQKKERRERLLNEIIEWAIDISRSRPEEIYRDIARIREEAKEQEFLAANIRIIMDSLVGMRGRNQYTSSIARKVDKTLKESVDKLINEMESYIALLYEWETIIVSAVDRSTAVNNTEEFDKAEYKEDFIKELANEVIEEATKIKTNDIS